MKLFSKQDQEEIKVYKAFSKEVARINDLFNASDTEKEEYVALKRKERKVPEVVFQNDTALIKDGDTKKDFKNLVEEFRVASAVVSNSAEIMEIVEEREWLNKKLLQLIIENNKRFLLVADQVRTLLPHLTESDTSKDFSLSSKNSEFLLVLTIEHYQLLCNKIDYFWSTKK